MKKKEQPKEKMIDIEIGFNKEETKIMGWICPICLSVISPYEKTCDNPECRIEVGKMVASYFKGEWRIVE